MSKYIIELGEDAKAIQSISITSLGNVYVDSWYVENLEELNSDYINEHFGSLQDDAYKRGLEDGKAVHDKGCEGCKYANVAGTHEPCVRCSNSYGNQWTAKDDKIEVGDEVKHKEYKKRFVVTKMQNGYIYGISEDGSWNNFRNDGGFDKTGRHFDIDKILKEMKGDNDK